MNSQKTRFTPWLIAFYASVLFLGGCGGTVVTLGFPLSNGDTWTYQGTLTYKLGRQEQSMPPLRFHLSCNELGGKRNMPFHLTLEEEDETLWSAQLVPMPKGLFNPIAGEYWIPNSVKTGRSWTITVNGEKIPLTLRSQTTTTVPAGTFPAYLIDFRRSRKTKGTLWLDPDVGIIEINWTSRNPGGETLAHLELSSYTFP